MLTNAPFTEGDPRQRVVSVLHPSPDLTQPGWLPPVQTAIHYYWHYSGGPASCDCLGPLNVLVLLVSRAQHHPANVE